MRRYSPVRLIHLGFLALLCPPSSRRGIGVVEAASQQQQQEEMAEALFRKTVQRWNSQKSYQPWHDFSNEIIKRFDKAEAVTDDVDVITKQQPTSQPPPPRLDLIGAMEESILMIERSTLHEGVNRQRDSALSRLYETYASSLLLLSNVECHLLALDPHTLLIGAETVKNKVAAASSSPSPSSNTPAITPSTHLCIENAENSLRNAVTLDATNSKAQKVLDKLLLLGGDGSASVHERKPKEFVAELFDSFADTFDDKLLKGLQYQVPKFVGEAVEELLRDNNNNNNNNNKDKKSYNNALDAGVGTGLAGRFLRPLVTQKMIGVDASKRMLDIAAKCTLSTGCGLETTTKQHNNNNKDDDDKPLYDGLLVMDLEEMTVANTLGQGSQTTKKKNRKKKKKDQDQEESSGFDLVVAADVLVYFGSLDNLLKTFQLVSLEGAMLVVSCERTTSEEAPLGWRLLPSGRFAHTKSHVLEAAQKAGYQLKLYREIVPRMEKGEEVLGHLFGFELQNKQTTTSTTGREEL